VHSASERDGFDVVIVGAGVVGAAVAAALAPRRSVLVIERARRPATGVTSRNSGVIHSGLYYPPGTLKARACIRGQALLYAWAERHGVPFARTGKVVVARDQAALASLAVLHANALAAGARDLEFIDARALAALEPALPPAAGALWCPNTGIVDPHALTTSLLAAAEGDGAQVAYGLAVTSITPRPAGIEVACGDDTVLAGALVNAAGLDSDLVARLAGADAPTLHPCRGDYFRLAARGRYRRLVYPVRAPGSPGLGVHLTLELDGGVRLGPDATYVERRDDFAPPEGDERRLAFLRAAEALLGPLPTDALRWDGCGIRPKLRGPQDPDERDFLVLEEPPGCIHLIGVESPGLTAALALAEEVAARLGA